MDEIQYFDQCEREAMGEFIGKVKKAIGEHHSGKNRGCFALCAFGYKDADLEPDGCTGIEEVVGCDEDTITVRVSGHKTLGPPECTDGYPMDVAQEIINGCGWGGDWSGDDWTLHFSEDVTVPYTWNDEWDDDTNFSVLADKVVDATRKACEPFEKDMEQLHRDFYALDTDTNDEE